MHASSSARVLQKLGYISTYYVYTHGIPECIAAANSYAASKTQAFRVCELHQTLHWSVIRALQSLAAAAAAAAAVLLLYC
jgi:predicted subunit of tRNA(5-methylaminomethyl-2-thiouridylate) methyltransferase